MAEIFTHSVTRGKVVKARDYTVKSNIRRGGAHVAGWLDVDVGWIDSLKILREKPPHAWRKVASVYIWRERDNHFTMAFGQLKTGSGDDDYYS